MRTGRRIPGVVPLGGVHAPISIVRMAVGDAYGAKEWREGDGDDEAAFRTERIERRICHAVAEFAFRQAERTGAKVFGGPKYTVSPVYEGMLKEEMDAAARRHPEVTYEPQLIDATFALLIASTGDPMVIPALNRDGDILSDLVLPLFGSIAGSESLLVAFDDDFEPDALMAEAAHGTAPALQGKNLANPMAMILAGAALLSHGDSERVAAGGPRDPRGVPRGRRAGRPHRRPARTCDDERVHRRGDRADADEARGVVARAFQRTVGVRPRPWPKWRARRLGTQRRPGASVEQRHALSRSCHRACPGSDPRHGRNSRDRQDSSTTRRRQKCSATNARTTTSTITPPPIRP